MDLSLLNEKQYAAVTAKEQYIRVIAGAGSGKTRVLTTRIAYMIEELNIPSYRIYAITFTNKAAKEMKERVDKMCGDQAVTLTTFHALAVRILSEDYRAIGYPKNFTIIDDEDQGKIIKDLAKAMDLSEDIKELRAYINSKKVLGLLPDQIKEEQFSGLQIRLDFYKAYQKKLDENFYLDFDDLLIKTVLLLKNNMEVREKWRKRIAHLLVDEFQDTNDVQFDMIKLLISPTATLYVVGDADQTIYTWRGANSSLIMDFQKHYPESETYILDLNYRSSQNILDAANNLINHNRNRVEKNLVSYIGQGAGVKIYNLQNANAEADLIARTIKGQGSENYAKTAVLFRSVYLSRTLEMVFNRYNIPYRIFGGIRFFERAEIKDILSYMKLFVNIEDDLSFLRIVNVPKRGIGDKTIESMQDYAEKVKVSIAEAFKMYKEHLSPRISSEIDNFFALFDAAKERGELTFSELADYLIGASGYKEMLLQKGEHERIANLEELKKYLDEYQANNSESTLTDLLQSIALFSAQDEIKGGEFVHFMTIHAAKGLEYDNIFLIGLSEAIFPNYRSILDGDIEEERRLAYVAFTRAKKNLYLTYNNDFNFNTKTMSKPSRFLKEARVSVINEPTIARTERAFTERIERAITEEVVINPWQVGDVLIHTFYGEGKVLEIIGGKLVRIEFAPAHGVKTILAKHESLRRSGNNG